MNRKLQVVALVGWLTLFYGCTPPVELEKESLAEATYVFQGTVLEPQSSTVNVLPASEETFKVHVDDVIFQKGVFTDLTGKEITVIAADRKLESNSEYFFYSEPVIFGRSVAVRLIEAKRGDRPDRKAVRNTHDRHELDLELRHADLVIRGRIERVEPYQQRERQRLTEHWPDLRLASLSIEEVLKGDVSNVKGLDFLFAGSRDVQWYQTPKVKPGDAAVFLLERGSERAKNLKISDRRYTLFRRLAVQPLERVGTIKELLQ